MEESTISQLVEPIDRSVILAWYQMSGTAGAALGYVIFGWVVFTLQHKYSWGPVDSYRIVFWVYAAVGLVKFAQSLILSSRCEVEAAQRAKKPESDQQRPLLTPDDQPDHVSQQNSRENPGRPRAYLPKMSSHTISLLCKLCLLFALDSLGSGIASTSWLVYFFHNKFGVEEGDLGNLFFITSILAAVSSLVAASIARRIGLIKTMVFTHLPASILLTLIPLPGNQLIAMALLILRSCITSMDSAPRQAFLAAAVQPEERTLVNGITNVCKTLSQAGGPIVAGFLGGIGKIGIAITIAGVLKGAYDILMMVLFLGYRTVEERAQDAIRSEEGEPDRSQSSGTS